MAGTVRTVRPRRLRLRTDLADLPDAVTPAAVVAAFVAAWRARH